MQENPYQSPVIELARPSRKERLAAVAPGVFLFMALSSFNGIVARMLGIGEPLPANPEYVQGALMVPLTYAILAAVFYFFLRTIYSSRR